MGQKYRLLRVALLLTAAPLMAIAINCCNSTAPATGPLNELSNPAADQGGTADNPQTAPLEFPQFPGTENSMVSVVRNSSDAVTVVPGNGFIDELGTDNRPGETDPAGYIIAPGGEDDLAWAIYGIGGFELERPVDLEIEVNGVIAPGGDIDLPMSYWIGLSNYSNYSWEWFGPFETAASLVLNSDTVNQRYVSMTNSLFYTVVVNAADISPTPENPDQLTAVEISFSTTSAINALSTDYYSTVPHYPVDIEAMLRAKGGAELDPLSQYAFISWMHLSDSASTDNEASYYEVYRQRIDGPNEGMMRLGLVGAPSSSFTDPTSNTPPAGPPLPGETYAYYIKATSSFGSTPYAHRDTCAIPLLPPKNFTASFALFSNRVELNWEAAEGAARYQIYRDDPTTPYASVDNVTTWRDDTLTDTDSHSYWVRGVNIYNHGGSLSNAATGKLNNEPIAHLSVGLGQDAGHPPLQVDFDGSGSIDPDRTGPGNGIVLYEWDIDGDGNYEHASSNPRFQFVYDSTYGSVTAVLRVTDIAGATDTDAVQIDVTKGPVAVLTANPVFAEPDQRVDFDARESFAPNGAIVDYEWDFDGDGIFNEKDNGEWPMHGAPQGFTRYSEPGTYNLTLRVTDSNSKTDIDTVAITVSTP